jgi:hypothetical protein
VALEDFFQPITIAWDKFIPRNFVDRDESEESELSTHILESSTPSAFEDVDIYLEFEARNQHSNATCFIQLNCIKTGFFFEFSSGTIFDGFVFLVDFSANGSDETAHDAIVFLAEKGFVILCCDD